MKVETCVGCRYYEERWPDNTTYSTTIKHFCWVEPGAPVLRMGSDRMYEKTAPRRCRLYNAPPAEEAENG